MFGERLVNERAIEIAAQKIANQRKRLLAAFAVPPPITRYSLEEIDRMRNAIHQTHLWGLPRGTPANVPGLTERVEDELRTYMQAGVTLAQLIAKQHRAMGVAAPPPVKLRTCPCHGETAPTRMSMCTPDAPCSYGRGYPRDRWEL